MLAAGHPLLNFGNTFVDVGLFCGGGGFAVGGGDGSAMMGDYEPGRGCRMCRSGCSGISRSGGRCRCRADGGIPGGHLQDDLTLVAHVDAAEARVLRAPFSDVVLKTLVAVQEIPGTEVNEGFTAVAAGQ